MKKGRKPVWDIEALKEILLSLKKEDDGSVREIPIKYLWENTRIKKNIIKWVGWHSKKVLQDTSKLIGLEIEVNESCCKQYELEGSIELRFK